tara:strand:- start:943 stop:1650 length:708 start_codon:yes stop_codon:yes gene_type:complete
MLWKITQHFLTTLVLIYSGIHWGVACIPSAYMVFYMIDFTKDFSIIGQSILIGMSIGLGIPMWMISNIFITALIGFIFKPKINKTRVPFFSIITIQWAFLSVIDRLAKPCVYHMVPSWITNFYYRAMGCKIGKDAIISSDRINDAYMVEIGHGSIIGSRALITAHIAEKNNLVLSPISIGNNCLIGLGAQINPGCVIEDNVVIASRAIVPKYTTVPSGETWAGIPAKSIKKKKVK